MKKISKFLIYFSLSLFLSCSVKEKTPDWVNSTQTSNDTWYGIGIVSKDKLNHRLIAQQIAYQEIAMQIEVHLLSEVESIQKKHNEDLDDLFISKIKTSVDLKFEDIKIINSYSDQTNFYVQASLSKHKYFQAIQLKKDVVFSKIMNMISAAEENFPELTLSYLIDAKNENLQYPDLIISNPSNIEEKMLLNSHIDKKINEFIDRIAIIPKNSKIKFQIGGNVNKRIEIICKDKINDQKLAGVPIRGIINSNLDHIINTVTDNNGIAYFQISNYLDSSTNQEITIYLDYKILEEQALIHTPTIIQIDLIPPIFFLDIKEYIENVESNKKYLSPTLEELLVKEFKSDISNNFADSNFSIIAEVSVFPASNKLNEYGMYVSYLDGLIKIIDSITKKEYYVKKINNIKGVSFASNDESNVDALQKLTKKVRDDFFDEMVLSLK